MSFETAAKAFDVNGATVTRPGEIAPALARGIRELREGRPFVMDVVAERVGPLAEFDVVSEVFDRGAADQAGVGVCDAGRCRAFYLSPQGRGRRAKRVG